eukprot:gene12292-15448_t
MQLSSSSRLTARHRQPQSHPSPAALPRVKLCSSALIRSSKAVIGARYTASPQPVRGRILCATADAAATAVAEPEDQGAPEDASVAPLKTALEVAKVRLELVTGTRNRLETEAQNVAQQSLEAVQAVRAAKDAVFDLVAAIDAGSTKQQKLSKEISKLKKKIQKQEAHDPFSEDNKELALTTAAQVDTNHEAQDPFSEDNKELAMTVAQLVDTDHEVERLREDLDRSYRSAVDVESTAAKAEAVAAAAMKAAEAAVKEELQAAAVVKFAAVNAEAVAAAAMKAAEAAVKEELQAAAVVKETRYALEKSSPQDSDWEKSRDQEYLDGVKETVSSTPAVQVVDVPKATSRAEEKEVKETSDTADAPSPSPTLICAAEKKEVKETSDKADAPSPSPTLILAAVACTVAALWYFLNSPFGTDLLSSSTLGQALIDMAAQAKDVVLSVVDVVKEKAKDVALSIVDVVKEKAEKTLLEAIVLLLSSCICVPLVVSKIPGGNPVLGYLLGGALVGPHALGIIRDVVSVQHFAELGVVFLLFNIGLELSLERLGGMAKQVFGMGSLQLPLTTLGVY